MSVRTYHIGDIVVLRCECRVGGVLTDPSTATVTVKRPSGGTATPTVTSGGVGVLLAQYAPTETGQHAVIWVTTGAAQGAEPDTFYVEPLP